MKRTATIEEFSNHCGGEYTTTPQEVRQEATKRNNNSHGKMWKSR